MTPLRHKMIESMRQRGFLVRTQQSYTSSVAALARYHGCSPERLEPDEVARILVSCTNAKHRMALTISHGVEGLVVVDR